MTNLVTAAIWLDNLCLCNDRQSHDEVNFLGYAGSKDSEVWFNHVADTTAFSFLLPFFTMDVYALRNYDL
jgi:hypothetical protein